MDADSHTAFPGYRACIPSGCGNKKAEKKEQKDSKMVNLAFNTTEPSIGLGFLISKKAITSRHNISPIEVKSSTRLTTTSLEKCIKKYGSHLAQAYIVYTGDLEKDGDYLYIPLYMVPCL